MSLILRSLTFTVIITAAAFAQTTSAPATNESPEVHAVRAVAREFALALDKDKIDDAKKLFAGVKEELQFVEQMHGAIQAAKQFRAAAIKKFPDLENDRKMSDDMTAKGLARHLDSTPVKIEGDIATYTDGTKLQKSGGQWKVICMFGDAQTRRMMTTVLPAMAGVMRDMTPEIEQGKYNTSKDLKETLQTRMREATMKVVQELTNQSQPGPKSGRETHPDK